MGDLFLITWVHCFYILISYSSHSLFCMSCFFTYSATPFKERANNSKIEKSFQLDLNLLFILIILSNSILRGKTYIAIKRKINKFYWYYKVDLTTYSKIAKVFSRQQSVYFKYNDSRLPLP